MREFLIHLLTEKDNLIVLNESLLPAVKWGQTIGLGSLIFEAIDKTSAQKNHPQIYAELQSAYYSAIFSTEDQSVALTDILKASKELGISVCLLKGMSVSHQYYPQPYWRLMRDIDVLLQAKDVPHFESMLIASGYQQLSENTHGYYQGHHHSMPFYSQEKNVWIEVHTQLFREGSWRSKIPSFSITNIATEISKASFGEYDVQRLSAELQLVYIACHWVDDFKPKGGVFALIDAMYLLRQEKELDWDKLLKWTSASKALALPVYLLLSNAKRHQLVEIEPKKLQQLRMNCGYARYLKAFVFNRIVDSYYLSEGRFGFFVNQFTLELVKDELTKPSLVPLVLRVMWGLVFPASNPLRYQLAWQSRRFIKMLGLAQKAG